MKNRCIFPGSFDPVTVGHMNLIERAAGIFDEVIVTVMVNIRKTGTIPAEHRARLLEKACGEFSNVSVEQWDGLLADYMRMHPDAVVIRGVRSTAEFEQEITASAINRSIYADMETLLMPSTEELSCISSSAVREIAAFGGDIGAYVPVSVRKEIEQYLKK